MSRPRGRPKIDTSTADTIIGKTANQLMIWGFPLRQIHAKLCKPAAEILSRTDSNGLPLSGDRIKQIHEQWKKKTREDNIPFERWRYTKRSLIRRRPSKSIDELTVTLFLNEGVWPVGNPEGFVDPGPEFSPRAERLSVLYPRIKRPSRKQRLILLIKKRK